MLANCFGETCGWTALRAPRSKAQRLAVIASHYTRGTISNLPFLPSHTIPPFPSYRFSLGQIPCKSNEHTNSRRRKKGKKFSTMLGELNWLTDTPPECTQPRPVRTEEEARSPSLSSHEMLGQLAPYCENRALRYIRAA